MKAIFFAMAALAGAGVLRAASRTSAGYELTIETIDAGGGRAGSASYALDSSTASSGGISSAAAPGVVAKTGYTGQLYEAITLTISATPATVNEGSTRQLDAIASLDDQTALVLDPARVQWSENSNALRGISAAGVAMAAPVFQNAIANVGGTYQTFTDTDGFDLTVFDLGESDTLGAYAGDGIDDGWQVHFFGEPPNPLAAPSANPDGDNGDNTFEFLTGFDPTDPADFFQLRIVSLVSATATFELNKVIPVRTYRLKAGASLPAFPETVTTFSVATETANHHVQDPNAAGPGKFYIIEVTKP